MRVAVIVQRYGTDVLGGSETLARQYAHALHPFAAVEVLTTCAADHATWRSHYPAGVTHDGPITVRRFAGDETCLRRPHGLGAARLARRDDPLAGAVLVRPAAAPRGPARRLRRFPVLHLSLCDDLFRRAPGAARTNGCLSDTARRAG